MNKKLIAVAVAGACVAPTVMAQSASPVTLYGRVHMSVESVEADAPTGKADIQNRTRMEDQASLLGVRGKEDLGGGLKAVFQLETAFSPDEASGTFANRNSGIGLEGSWGTVIVGRWDTPMKQTQTKVDPWGDVLIAAPSKVYLDQGNFRRRQANSINYDSPKFMGGFDIQLMWSPNEGRTATANPQIYDVALSYTGKALYASLAYEEHKDSYGGTTTANAKEEGTAFAASYKIGGFNLFGQYGEFKKSQPGSSVKDKSYLVGGKYTMGKHNFIANYANAEEGKEDCDQISVGYQYVFSKRTFMTAHYSEIDNSAGMNCSFNGGSLGGTGYDPKGFGVSLRHVF